LNSATFGFSTEIHSVRHALSILGDHQVRRWIRLVATLGAGQNRTSELVLSALVRARFCELLSPRLEHGESDLFLMGLLSGMDAILEVPINQVLENLPIDNESKAVLLGEPCRLQPLYQLMLAQESGAWQNSKDLTSQLHLDEVEVAKAYWQAMEWAREMNSGS
jgi:EAL and modified HD-GYP domain-containing signal transduction protein